MRNKLRRRCKLKADTSNIRPLGIHGAHGRLLCGPKYSICFKGYFPKAQRGLRIKLIYNIIIYFYFFSPYLAYLKWSHLFKGRNLNFFTMTFSYLLATLQQLQLGFTYLNTKSHCLANVKLIWLTYLTLVFWKHFGVSSNFYPAFSYLFGLTLVIIRPG